MPYIPKDRRLALWGQSKIDHDSYVKTKGELNYWITESLIDFINTYGISYHSISDAANAAKDAAIELERRLLGPYEDKMAKKNGDLYKELIKELKKL